MAAEVRSVGRLDLEALTSRFVTDVDTPPVANGPTARAIAALMDALGWRSASDAPAAAVAPEIAMMIAACVRGHRDLVRLRRGVAECLRRHSHPLDGSGTSVAAWEPFAAQLLGRYVSPVPGRGDDTAAHEGA